LLVAAESRAAPEQAQANAAASSVEAEESAPATEAAPEEAAAQAEAEVAEARPDETAPAEATLAEAGAVAAEADADSASSRGDAGAGGATGSDGEADLFPGPAGGRAADLFPDDDPESEAYALFRKQSEAVAALAVIDAGVSASADALFGEPAPAPQDSQAGDAAAALFGGSSGANPFGEDDTSANPFGTVVETKNPFGDVFGDEDEESSNPFEAG
jgi:hypothetical protein